MSSPVIRSARHRTNGAPPAKRQPGSANFAIAEPALKLVLLEGAPGDETRLDHLGVEVESTEQVASASTRLGEAGLSLRAEEATTCCYAVQDKVGVDAPGAEPWEIYTVLADDRRDLEGRTGSEESAVSGDGSCCGATDSTAPGCC